MINAGSCEGGTSEESEAAKLIQATNNASQYHELTHISARTHGESAGDQTKMRTELESFHHPQNMYATRQLNRKLIQKVEEKSKHPRTMVLTMFVSIPRYV